MVSIRAELLQDLYQTWKTLPHRERKNFIMEQAASPLFQCHWATLYRRMKSFEKQGAVRSSRADRGKPRVADLDIIRQDMKQIAAVVNGTAPGRKNVVSSIEDAMTFCYQMGWLHQKYSVQTARRWMTQFGISRKQMKRPVACVHILIKNSNDVWYVDATPANQIFLPQQGPLVRDATYYDDRSHAADRLKSNFLDRIWIYTVVDGKSSVFYAKAYAGLHLGENAAHYVDILSDCMLPKKNGSPFQGRPKLIYSDQGSGLIANKMQDFFTYLDISHQTHEVGRPQAKGKVEARIGAIKRQIETLMALCTIETVDQFNSILQSRVHYYCQKKGYYDIWLKHLDGSYRTCTREDIIHAQEQNFERVVDRYGCVSIAKEPWFVNEDIVGQRVNLTTSISGIVVARTADGKLFECSKGRKDVELGTYRAMHTSDMRRMQMEVVDESKRILGLVRPEHLIQEPMNMSHINNRKGIPLDKEGSIPLESYDSAETAWLYISFALGIRRDDLPAKQREDVDFVFQSHLSTFGHISRDIILKVTNLLKQEVLYVEAK